MKNLRPDQREISGDCNYTVISGRPEVEDFLPQLSPSGDQREHKTRVAILALLIFSGFIWLGLANHFFFFLVSFG